MLRFWSPSWSPPEHPHSSRQRMYLPQELSRVPRFAPVEVPFLHSLVVLAAETTHLQRSLLPGGMSLLQGP